MRKVYFLLLYFAALLVTFLILYCFTKTTVHFQISDVVQQRHSMLEEAPFTVLLLNV